MSSADETGSRVEARRFGRPFQFVLVGVLVLGAMTALSAWSMTRSPLAGELAPYASSAGNSRDNGYYGVSFYVDGYRDAEMRRLLKEKFPRKRIGGQRYMSGVVTFPDIELNCLDEQRECRITFWHKMGFFEAQLRHRGWLR